MNPRATGTSNSKTINPNKTLAQTEMKILVDYNGFFLARKERPTEAPFRAEKKPVAERKIVMKCWT